ncbi:MAG: cell surface protein, partial [Planctomycetaceae bacterium]|nr:cell surface protein [Planctomycetaceae bacterium]
MKSFRTIFTTLPALALLVATLPASAQENALTSIEVSPPDVNLNTLRDRQSLIVQAKYANGITRDVTAEAKWTLANPALCKFENFTLTPAADGATEMTVEFGGQMVKLPVVVKDATVERPISFKLDVMPVFMKSGCNMGSCHGAARGKDGFRLSLFGFDPDGDHYRLTHEISGRRINL